MFRAPTTSQECVSAHWSSSCKVGAITLSSSCKVGAITLGMIVKAFQSACFPSAIIFAYNVKVGTQVMQSLY